MAKLYAELENENGKRAGKSGDKWIEIDLHVGADRIGRIILDYQGGREWELSYEKNDGSPSYLIDEKTKGNKQQSKLPQYLNTETGEIEYDEDR